MLHSPNKTNNFVLVGLTWLSARGQLCHMCKIWSYGWWEATVPGIKSRGGDRRKSTVCCFCRFALCDCTAATIKKNLFCKLVLMIHIKPQNGRIYTECTPCWLWDSFVLMITLVLFPTPISTICFMLLCWKAFGGKPHVRIRTHSK